MESKRVGPFCGETLLGKKCSQCETELDTMVEDGDILTLINALTNKYVNSYGCCLQFFSDEWHANNTDAANHFFGFNDWNETKEYIHALFPEIAHCKFMLHEELVENEFCNKKKINMMHIEHCLIAKMFMHSIPVCCQLAMLFGVLDSLKDVIWYSNIILLQHMHSWGHAMMNLAQPLWKPLIESEE